MSEDSNPQKPAKREDNKKNPAFEPLPIIQDDQAALDEEMEELFNEDKVTHRHGSSEPERD